MRRAVLLRIVRALYSMPKCSFSLSLELYKQDDVYYFPDGAAFCKSEKPTAFMAASMLAVNPNSKMIEVTRNKGLNYVNKGLALTDGSARDEPAPAAAASSTPAAVAKKKPAAAKTIQGAATKKK